MNLGIYRPGQGYWVRVLTAVAAGVLVLATAGWLFNQMVRVPIPVKHWTVSTLARTGTPAQGEVVSLYRNADSADAFASGTVEIATTTGTAVTLQVTDLVVTDTTYDPINAQYVKTPSGYEGDVPSNSVAKVQMFEQIYLQAAAAGIAMLFGALVVYYLVAAKPGAVDFLVSTDGEMKKVNWSTKRDVYRSTLVVIFSSLVIAAGLFAVDTAFASFFKAVGVLE